MINMFFIVCYCPGFLSSVTFVKNKVYSQCLPLMFLKEFSVPASAMSDGKQFQNCKELTV